VEALAQFEIKPNHVFGEVQGANDAFAIGDEQHFAQRRVDPVDKEFHGLSPRKMVVSSAQALDAVASQQKHVPVGEMELGGARLVHSPSREPAVDQSLEILDGCVPPGLVRMGFACRPGDVALERLKNHSVVPL
jgi:hypothetical protein